MQASLEEKEVLLREVHHRVKNNLQIISSLLSLQAHEATDPQTLEMFAESQSRIRSMALIHEQLYRSNQFASIDFGPYARQLCEHLQRAAVPDKQITLQVDSAAPPLSLDQAVPCGMVLSELVANALKHAFPAGQPGEVRVEFTAADGLRRLVVADNGVGIGCLPRQQRNSLGLTVVECLCGSSRANSPSRVRSARGSKSHFRRPRRRRRPIPGRYRIAKRWRTAQLPITWRGFYDGQR